MATRIERLAQPKPNLLKFPDRRSVYWLDEHPVKSHPTTTAFVLTPRWSQLAECKKFSCYFEDSSRPPQWTVSSAALKAQPCDRICSLALPRLPAEGWQPDRPLLSTISVAVKTAKASPRICQLACPKIPIEPYTKTSDPTTPKSKPSSRTVLLATPKQIHPEYLPDRPVSRPVTRSAYEAIASERLQVLARPKPQKPLFEGYDPYRVSLAARAATASPRLHELALPLERRCRTK